MKTIALSIALLIFAVCEVSTATAGLGPVSLKMGKSVERVSGGCPPLYHRDYYGRCVPDRYISSTRFCRPAFPGGPPRCRRF